MDKLVLFLGPNAAGKTTLARKVCEERPYEYMSGDNNWDEIVENKILARRLIEKSICHSDKNMRSCLQGYKNNSDSELLERVENLSERQQDQLVNIVFGLFLVEKITTCEKIPLYEGFFVNRRQRLRLYNDLVSFLPGFDSICKNLFFVDVDYEITEKRLIAKGVFDKKQALKTEMRNRMKDIPSNSEWPNTKVHYIDGSRPVEVSAAEILGILDQNS
jgi:hypothetical protein